MADVEIGCNCGGCLFFIIIFLVFWALLFGVTFGEKHYALDGCSEDRGVEVKVRGDKQQPSNQSRGAAPHGGVDAPTYDAGGKEQGRSEQ